MNKDALFSDGTSDYVSPAQPDWNEKITLRFRTAQNDVDEVRILLETGKYAVSGTGSDGELSTAGRETEYYHDCMGGNGMLFTGHGIDFCQERAVFL